MKRKILFLIIFSATLFAQDKLPEWAKGIVWYQMFPERFSNGDPTNDPEARKYLLMKNRFRKIGK